MGGCSGLRGFGNVVRRSFITGVRSSNERDYTPLSRRKGLAPGDDRVGSAIPAAYPSAVSPIRGLLHERHARLGLDGIRSPHDSILCHRRFTMETEVQAYCGHNSTLVSAWNICTLNQSGDRTTASIRTLLRWRSGGSLTLSVRVSHKICESHATHPRVTVTPCTRHLWLREAGFHSVRSCDPQDDD